MDVDEHIHPLVLLQHLKVHFPTAQGSSGHHLFVSAFMLASKVIYDDTYSDKSRSIVAQGVFQPCEINQMEREMCQYLEQELNVDLVTLRECVEMVENAADNLHGMFFFAVSFCWIDLI